MNCTELDSMLNPRHHISDFWHGSYLKSEISHYFSSVRENIGNHCKEFEVESCIKRTVPIVDWLFNYEWKKDIVGDVIAGITVAVMHIPQGMAYAILGNVPPITGIYMAFFPVLVYAIFGTSRHNSMGTFAVICMMTGKVVLSHATLLGTANNTKDLSNNTLGLNSEGIQYTPTEVATAVTFMVALMQLAMYLLQLGVISSLLSETLVSGFTTGAAVHVLTSQIKDLFGLKLDKRKGLFKVILTYVDIVTNIENVNISAMILSSITIIAIVINNEVLKPQVAKRCPIPIPIEMIVVVLGTVSSMYMNMADTYGISTVGQIPVGLPEPKLPPFGLLGAVALDSFIITMVSYTISMSMALIFAQKLNYEVNPNQELFAQGLGNLVGSFFSCMPSCASLSRSLIQQTVGGRTQLASFISCSILLSVLLWIGPFFELLPRCILAGIIIVALKGMLLQVKDLLKFWRMSKMDATIWIMTFLSVVIFDVEYGLFVGAALCIGNLLTLTMRPYTCKLALVPGTEFFLDVKRYKGTVEVPGVKILHYCGGLNFASRQHFRKQVYQTAGVVPQKELILRLKNSEKENAESTNKVNVVALCKDIVKKLTSSHEWKRQLSTCAMAGYSNVGFEGDTCTFQETSPVTGMPYMYSNKLRVLILDFSALIHIDPAGVAMLRSLVEEYKKIEVSLYIAGCSGPVFDTIRKCDLVEQKESYFTLFPTVNDAVSYAQHKGQILPNHIWSSFPVNLDENSISRFAHNPALNPNEESFRFSKHEALLPVTPTLAC
ncbi:solute carrier family 26 member 10-like isoform X3 [Belonocnema kinseyi]|uniref:solute carrier family 26 member 10-like isoform X3 n=1 Tax=Belonocnema kinseyi TaxID=2817044 RepID=UPI00143D2A24|nr:solute carrier family 26 member 10-like isoform X3 [Belonocnema kinseyi]XP_033223044.1 solute carrier family 26 member 10-like isoform X3 [Belonocnema kinseyi]XP_033223045.1 solute carrier family 26 member 10-like isoform X3 [Belonocnema kinseyi]XP_033223046.1 solute carrier family 26 member 10-like isoform X3 [Belonocnema kinseyi]